MNKAEVKEKLYNKTNCGTQNAGWCCNTCWFSLELPEDAPDDESLWHTVLVYRGDYKMGDVINQSKQEYRDNLKWLKAWLKK